MAKSLSQPEGKQTSEFGAPHHSWRRTLFRSRRFVETSRRRLDAGRLARSIEARYMVAPLAKPRPDHRASSSSGFFAASTGGLAMSECAVQLKIARKVPNEGSRFALVPRQCCRNTH